MSKIDLNSFNKLIFGRKYEAYWLNNSNGIKILISTFGARVIALYTPDKNGNFKDIVLGYNTLGEYISGNPFFGVTIGRCANRIAKGKFELDGTSIQLSQNNYPNHLHGGSNGFHNRNWKVEQATSSKVTLSYLSPDGHENYPGNLKTVVCYSLNNDNELQIDYTAETDKKTIVNLSHHSFFNLKGESEGDVLDHYIKIYADYITPVNSHQIPTGRLQNVMGSPFDFSTFEKIGEQLKRPDDQLKIGNGFDINYVLSSYEYDLAADVYEKESGRGMQVYTSMPGMQFYTGNFLDGSDTGKSGKRYYKHAGFCLEPQKFPDAINNEDFPSVVLEPGDTYSEKITYKFYVKE